MRGVEVEDLGDQWSLADRSMWAFGWILSGRLLMGCWASCFDDLRRQNGTGVWRKHGLALLRRASGLCLFINSGSKMTKSFLRYRSAVNVGWSIVSVGE